ncbi:MAG: hypothetical protein N2749_00540 [Clostridia bacterium]|nr:hypothetical protein [Clostridia bacterium]
MDECIYHKAMEEKVSALEKAIEDLKINIQNKVSKEELNLIIEKLEEDIQDLKNDNEFHFKSGQATQQTLARLEEMNKYLKQMLDSYSEQAKSLSEKMDKINETLNDKIDKLYNLILNFKKPQEDGGEKKKSLIENLLGNVKITLTIIFLLVATIIYLLTGNWIVKELP